MLPRTANLQPPKVMVSSNSDTKAPKPSCNKRNFALVRTIFGQSSRVGIFWGCQKTRWLETTILYFRLASQRSCPLIFWCIILLALSISSSHLSCLSWRAGCAVARPWNHWKLSEKFEGSGRGSGKRQAQPSLQHSASVGMGWANQGWFKIPVTTNADFKFLGGCLLFADHQRLLLYQPATTKNHEKPTSKDLCVMKVFGSWSFDGGYSIMFV